MLHGCAYLYNSKDDSANKPDSPDAPPRVIKLAVATPTATSFGSKSESDTQPSTLPQVPNRMHRKSEDVLSDTSGMEAQMLGTVFANIVYGMRCAIM